MNWKKKFLFILVLISCSVTYGQTNANKDTATVNALIEQSKSLVGTDSAKAVNLALQAKEMANELNYPKGEAYALKNIGLMYYLKGMYAETLDFWNQSLKIFEDMNDDVGVANMLSNIGAVYLNQGADAKALEYSLRSLQIAEKINETLLMITALSNVGGIYYNKKDPVALNYLL
jgi:adenylate cyclase